MRLTTFFKGLHPYLEYHTSRFPRIWHKAVFEAYPVACACLICAHDGIL